MYLHARDYKAFAGEVRLTIAPLTIVFGANGSGKSALVRLPAFLSAALRPSAESGPGLPWRIREMDSGSSLLSLCHGGSPTGYGLTLGFDGAELSVDIGRATDSPAHLPGQWVQAWRLLRGETESAHLTWDRKEGRYLGIDAHVTRFRGLQPSIPRPVRGDPSIVIDFAGPTVEHLGPHRDPGDTRFIATTPNPVWDVGFRGEATGQVLASLRAAGREDILGRLQDVLRDVVGVELNIQDLQVGPSSGIAIQARRVGRASWQPLHDLGTGVAHALPVVVQFVAAAMAGPQDDPPDLIVVEEPESHLHPGAQACLADVLLEAARARRSRALVETHSETLILRVQRRVAEDPALAEHVRLVFVDDEGARTVLRDLAVSADGAVPGWPDGWFDAALEEVRAIGRARQARDIP